MLVRPPLKNCARHIPFTKTLLEWSRWSENNKLFAMSQQPDTTTGENDGYSRDYTAVILQVVFFFVVLPMMFVSCCMWNKRARRLANLPIDTTPQKTIHTCCSAIKPPKKGGKCVKPIVRKLCTWIYGMGGINPVTSTATLLLGMAKEVSENIFAWINYSNAAPFLTHWQERGVLYITFASGACDVVGFIVMAIAIRKCKLKKVKIIKPSERNTDLHAVNVAEAATSSSSSSSESILQYNKRKTSSMAVVQENVMMLEFFSDTLRIFCSSVFFFQKIKGGLNITEMWSLATIIISLLLSSIGANSALRKRLGLAFRRDVYQVQSNEADPLYKRWWCMFVCNTFSQSLTTLLLLIALIVNPANFSSFFDCCEEMPCYVLQEKFDAGICDDMLSTSTGMLQCANDPTLLFSLNASTKALYVSCPKKKWVAGPRCNSCRSAYPKNQAMFDTLTNFNSSRRSLVETAKESSLNDHANADPGCDSLKGLDGKRYEAVSTLRTGKTPVAMCCPVDSKFFDADECIPYPYMNEFENRPMCICGPAYSFECGLTCFGNCSECNDTCDVSEAKDACVSSAGIIDNYDLQNLRCTSPNKRISTKINEMNTVVQASTCLQNNQYIALPLRTCESAWEGYQSRLACNANVQKDDTVVYWVEILAFSIIILSTYFWALAPASSCIYGCCLGCCFCEPHGFYARFKELKKRGVPVRIVVLDSDWFDSTTKNLILVSQHVTSKTETELTNRNIAAAPLAEIAETELTNTSSRNIVAVPLAVA